MKFKDIKHLSKSELQQELVNKSKELLNLRMRKASGTSVKTHLFKQASKDIARILTALHQSN